MAEASAWYFDKDEKDRAGSSYLLCESCDRRVDITTVVQCCDGHLCCRQCVQTQAKEAVYYKKKSVPCLKMGCNSFYPADLLLGALDATLMELLEEQWARMEAADQGIEKCLHCGSVTVSIFNVPRLRFQCTQDRETICSFCNRSWNCIKPETCNLTSSVRPARCGVATDLEGLGTLPSHWSGDNDKSNALVTVDPGSKEYMNIARFFRRSMSKEIFEIQRVENAEMWQVYSLTRAHMLQKNGPVDINEMRLFHGTVNENIEAIVSGQNIDPRMNGRNGILYGAGSYFAKEAKYSHRYCRSKSLRAAAKKQQRKNIKAITTQLLGQDTYRQDSSSDDESLNTENTDGVRIAGKDTSITSLWTTNKNAGPKSSQGDNIGEKDSSIALGQKVCDQGVSNGHTDRQSSLTQRATDQNLTGQGAIADNEKEWCQIKTSQTNREQDSQNQNTVYCQATINENEQESSLVKVSQINQRQNLQNQNAVDCPGESVQSSTVPLTIRGERLAKCKNSQLKVKTDIEAKEAALKKAVDEQKEILQKKFREIPANTPEAEQIHEKLKMLGRSYLRQKRFLEKQKTELEKTQKELERQECNLQKCTLFENPVLNLPKTRQLITSNTAAQEQVNPDTIGGNSLQSITAATSDPCPVHSETSHLDSVSKQSTAAGLAQTKLTSNISKTVSTVNTQNSDNVLAHDRAEKLLYACNTPRTECYENCMIVARVLVGKYTQGHERLRRPPLISPNKLYDSCVNNVANPSIFVIFDRSQYYPEYIIRYNPA